jgi:hypothetical protein
VLDHHRRYTRARLLALFDESFEVVYCSYYNVLLSPVKLGFVFFDRLKRRIRPQAELRSYNDVPAPFINSVFKHILTLEASILSRAELPFGVSLVCLLRKRAAARG